MRGYVGKCSFAAVIARYKTKPLPVGQHADLPQWLNNFSPLFIRELEILFEPARFKKITHAIFLSVNARICAVGASPCIAAAIVSAIRFDAFGNGSASRCG